MTFNIDKHVERRDMRPLRAGPAGANRSIRVASWASPARRLARIDHAVRRRSWAVVPAGRPTVPVVQNVGKLTVLSARAAISENRARPTRPAKAPTRATAGPSGAPRLERRTSPTPRLGRPLARSSNCDSDGNIDSVIRAAITSMASMYYPSHLKMIIRCAIKSLASMFVAKHQDARQGRSSYAGAWSHAALDDTARRGWGLDRMACAAPDVRRGVAAP